MSITSTNKKAANITKLTVTAMLSAIAIALQYIEFSVPFVPSFLKFDFSDVPELIGAFAISPLYGAIICLIKNLVHLPVSQSMFVGELANFVLGVCFVVPAGIIYKYTIKLNGDKKGIISRETKTKKGAVIGCFVGAVVMAVMSIVTNYTFVYPIYAKLWFGGNIDAIVDIYKTILPSSDTLIKSLLIFNLPFTFVKGIVVAIITIIIYKPLSKLIVKMNNSLSKKV